MELPEFPEHFHPEMPMGLRIALMSFVIREINSDFMNRIPEIKKEVMQNNKIMNSGEYQLPDALRNMVKKGAKFFPGAVQDWMDCGNKDAMVDTNNKYLGYKADKTWISPSLKSENSLVIQPCYIGENVVLRNSVVGPGVSIGDGSIVESSVIKNSIVLPGVQVQNANIANSMIGAFAKVSGTVAELSLGDYSVIKN